LGCENGASLYVYIVPTSDFALFTVTIVCVIMEIDFPSFRVLKLCSFFSYCFIFINAIVATLTLFWLIFAANMRGKKVENVKNK